MGQPVGHDRVGPADEHARWLQACDHVRDVVGAQRVGMKGEHHIRVIDAGLLDVCVGHCFQGDGFRSKIRREALCFSSVLDDDADARVSVVGQPPGHP